MRDQIQVEYRDKTLLLFFLVALLLSLSVCYFRFMALKDFTIFENEEDIPISLIEL